MGTRDTTVITHAATTAITGALRITEPITRGGRTTTAVIGIKSITSTITTATKARSSCEGESAGLDQFQASLLFA